LRDAHGIAAGEFVFCGEFVDFVFLAEAFNDIDERRGPRRLVVACGVPQSFQVANLFRLNRLVKILAKLFRDFGFGGLIEERLLGSLFDSPRFVAREDLAFSLFEHRD
jgi:hypothetical protein